MHRHIQPFKWLPSTRVHKRPPRIFMKCSVCGKECQGVVNIDGSFHDFETNRKRSEKRSQSFWVTDIQAQKIRAMLNAGEL